LLMSRPLSTFSLHAPCTPRNISFSFYSHADPSDLHSFPTRRSSDLSGYKQDAIQTLRAAAKSELELPPPLGLPEPVKPAPELLGDRKSTRLNSSHRTISYAVFCLKKKISVNRVLSLHCL